MDLTINISNKIKLPNAKMIIDLSLAETANQITNKAWDYAPFKSGTLRRAIMFERLSYDVYKVITNNIPYAKIQEYWWIITPKNAKMLSFIIWWKRVFAKKVIIKPKRYFQKAIDYVSPKISDIFENIIKYYT